VISIDTPPILAVRTMGSIGWTSQIRAEIQPVSANAASTITKVTAALDGPGISTIASQGSTAPAANATLTASASLSGAVKEVDVMPNSASAWAPGDPPDPHHQTRLP
jgi:hypothetical protein